MQATSGTSIHLNGDTPEIRIVPTSGGEHAVTLTFDYPGPHLSIYGTLAELEHLADLLAIAVNAEIRRNNTNVSEPETVAAF